MSSNEANLFDDFEGNPPVDEAVIRNFELQSGIKLPSGYVQLLKRMNGGEGFFGSNYVILYRVEELIEHNRGYRFEEYVPGLFLFGSNGGGEAFAFDRRITNWPVVTVPFIPLDLKEAVTIAPSFDAFLEALSKRVSEQA